MQSGILGTEHYEPLEITAAVRIMVTGYVFGYVLRLYIF